MSIPKLIEYVNHFKIPQFSAILSVVIDFMETTKALPLFQNLSPWTDKSRSVLPRDSSHVQGDIY